MNKYPLLIALIVSLMFASSAMAAGYGAAGCGFGGAVIKDNKILPQIGAWFLNGLLGNQTFAMTSGTSNCGGLGTKAMNDQEQFVKSNYPSLAKEMAAGEGENLTALAGLMGCSANGTGQFAVFAKQNYGSIFPNEQTTPTDMLNTLKREISSDPEMAAACPKI
jgi:Protein of unknown function (DUF3015)